ncbi:MAG TPA: hypothetical protein VFU47_13575, partial [Armatimonadota bacterium]|nr:hypothetical protein [Armatimonadota bacterium]
RGFGARVETDQSGARIAGRDRTMDAAEVGAEYRDYGWWVPLRRTAEALGWRAHWSPRAREAVVDTGRVPARN